MEIAFIINYQVKKRNKKKYQYIFNINFWNSLKYKEIRALVLRLFVYTTAQEILSRLKAHRALAGFRSLGTFFPLENFSLPLSAFHTPVYYTAYNEAILHIDAKSTHPWPVAVGGYALLLRQITNYNTGGAPRSRLRLPPSSPPPPPPPPPPLPSSSSSLANN